MLWQPSQPLFEQGEETVCIERFQHDGVAQCAGSVPAVDVGAATACTGPEIDGDRTLPRGEQVRADQPGDGAWVVQGGTGTGEAGPKWHRRLDIAQGSRAAFCTGRSQGGDVRRRTK